MTREQLERAIADACAVAGDREIYVFGSQAILADYPEAPPQLRQSVELDVCPKGRLDRVHLIDGALGELSEYQAANGFYVQGVPIHEAAVLPHGWQRRLRPVRVGAGAARCVGWCLEAHDLAASKLAAFRPKDFDYVRVLLLSGLIRAKVLVSRIQYLDIPTVDRDRLLTWVLETARSAPKPAAPARRRAATRKRRSAT